MHDRSALGPVDVTDDTLAAMVADLLEVAPPSLSLVSSRAEEVPYDLTAITTGGRWWVRGEAMVGTTPRPFAMFVKQVHEWSRSPVFALVPPELREFAAAQVPWRTEGAVYRSPLTERLPDGLAMPRALAVRDLDDLSYAVWLEVVPVAETHWDLQRYRRAAHLLGRFAGDAGVRALAAVGGHEWDVGRYVEGRLRFQVLPALADDGLWRHPLVAPAFADLRPRLERAAADVDVLAAELMGLPVLVGHGDACPNNLLVRPDRDGFTMIDFGFFTAVPVGFDLGQLLVGDVQIGRRGAEDLAERDATCLAAYVEGLVAGGTPVDTEVVRRAHALQLVLFTALSAPPLELLDAEPTEQLHAVVATRAAVAGYALDQLDATG